MSEYPFINSNIKSNEFVYNPVKLNTETDEEVYELNIRGMIQPQSFCLIISQIKSFLDEKDMAVIECLDYGLSNHLPKINSNSIIARKFILRPSCIQIIND